MTNDYLSPWVLLCRHINHWTKVLADTLGLSSFEVEDGFQDSVKQIYNSICIVVVVHLSFRKQKLGWEEEVVSGQVGRSWINSTYYGGGGL